MKKDTVKSPERTAPGAPPVRFSPGGLLSETGSFLVSFFTEARAALTLSSIRRRAPLAAAYVSSLYYFEIIYLMFAVLLTYGKVLSVALGVVLSLLLAVQTVGIYYKKNLCRRIMLVMIDLHVPFAAAFFYNMFTLGFDVNRASMSLLVVRAVLVALELPLLWLLTDDEVRTQYL